MGLLRRFWVGAGRGWTQRYWPTELLPQLRLVESERPKGSRIFNEYELGGFLIYFTPGLKVFIDDRCELYGDSWLEEYATAADHHPERIDDWSVRFRFDHAIVRAGSSFDRFMEKSSRWDRTGASDAFSLYQRRARCAESETGEERGAREL